MTPPAGAALVAVLDRRTLVQFTRYGLSGGAAAATHLAVLVVLIELAASPPILASVLGFACATVVNYALQHRFVFARSRGHASYFPRYLAVTLATMTLNTLLFWTLSSGIGIHYLASQVITIGVIVPINFAANRSFTFAT
ncbi:MAG TPA: GtrA family protein [Geminicoccaceae bacterium]|nr:GtrA family protein [Geminicoccaceae bacterium]